MSYSRREFLAFLGRGAVGTEAALLALSEASFAVGSSPFAPLPPSDKDELILADGFHYDILLKWGDVLNAKGEKFGLNADFTAFIPLDGKKNDGLLWVNHEFPEPRFLVSGYEEGGPRTELQVLQEQDTVGGSLVRIKKEGSKWKWLPKDPYNRRLTAKTIIPFAWDEPIGGSKEAVGTLANCSGGVTPWGTVLSAEENFEDYYGDVDRTGKPAGKEPIYGWNQFHKRTPLHYGWIVEVNPKTGEAKKLVALGRFCHEGATVVTAKDGRAVVYMGDDTEDRCLYKFVAAKPGSLERGTLYVADTVKGRWIPLDREKNETLKKEFKTQTEVLTHTREAAVAVGGTPLHRPEDIAVDPVSGHVIISLTNSSKHGDLFGALFRVVEKGKDPTALEFESSTFLAGGPETGFACPDNLEFDRKGNLWMTSDMSAKVLNKEPYTKFGNNGLFCIPTTGPQAGKALRVASAPREAEFTGPWFSPDGETLFLSVQHPGETSTKGDLKSHWPAGGKALPASAVVAISGKAFQKLL